MIYTRVYYVTGIRPSSTAKKCAGILGRRVGIRTEHAGRVAATTVVSYSYEQEINTHLVNRKKK